MKIFKLEKDAGLAAQIRANSSIAYVSKLEPLDKESAFALKIAKAVASEEHPSDTLYLMKDILVTTGWNLNTDVFDNGETFIARNTPVHHPLNFEHDEKRIIGNITTSQAVNEKMEPLPSDLAVEELPEKFHVLNGSVIYKVWQDEEQQKLIDKTIAEIEAGDWYVSMECVFKGFDYAVIRPDGTSGIIARNEESAFLTKHLRHYGGTGIYKCDASGNEFKLGRVLRNINFIGKGLVRRPANPESVILNHVSAFISNSQDLEYIKAEAGVTSTIQPETEKIEMSEPNVDVKRLEDRVSDLVKQNENLVAQLKDKDGEATKAQIEGLKFEVTNRDNKIDTLQASFDELKKTVDELTKRAEDAESAKTKAEEDLNRLTTENVKNDRLAILTGKGASADKAAELVNKFAKFSAEEFNTIVETLSVAWVNTSTQKKPTEVINNAKPEKDEASLAVNTTEEDQTQERVAKAAKFIGSILRYQAPKTQD